VPDAGPDVVTIKLDASMIDSPIFTPAPAPATGPKSQIIIVANAVASPNDGISSLVGHFTTRGFKVATAIFASSGSGAASTVKNALFLDDAKTMAVDYSQYGLVIVTQDANGSTAMALVGAAIPVICGERVSEAMNLVAASSSGEASTKGAVSMVNFTHFASAYLSGTALLTDQINQSLVKVSIGTPASSAIIIATEFAGGAAGTPMPSIFVYEKAAAMISQPAPERRVHFFLRDSQAYPVLSAKAWLLFDAAADWAMNL
jgi:hypothetical protein